MVRRVYITEILADLFGTDRGTISSLLWYAILALWGYALFVFIMEYLRKLWPKPDRYGWEQNSKPSEEAKIKGWELEAIGQARVMKHNGIHGLFQHYKVKINFEDGFFYTSNNIYVPIGNYSNDSELNRSVSRDKYFLIDKSNEWTDIKSKAEQQHTESAHRKAYESIT